MTGGIVWLASYPKSGNTWLRVLLQNLESGASGAQARINRLTFGMVASSRSWLDEELGFATADLTEDEIDRLRPFAYDRAAPANGPPYFFKIHDAYRLLDDGTPLIGKARPQRAIYVVRNPLDVALSYSHQLGRPIDETIAVLEDPNHCLAASKSALRRQVRQRLGTWSDHVSAWLDAPDLQTCLVRYEALQDAPIETLRSVVDFLSWPQDEDELRIAVERSAFQELARQEQETGFDERPPGMSHFFRSGSSGEWREGLTRSQADRVVAAHGAVMRRLGYLDSEGGIV